MNTYTFYIDELNQIWSRTYIKVDADTKEEAINKCLDEEYSITDAKYLYDTYNIPYIFITRGEFGLYNYGGKDFSDLHKCYSIKQLNQFINETITYAEIKFKSENSQISYMQRLSEINLPY